MQSNGAAVVVLVAPMMWLGVTACQLVLDTSPLTDGPANVDAAFEADATTDSPSEGSPSDARCKGSAGPTPVFVPSAGYCVDSTEVTAGQYKAFVDAVGAPSEADVCAFKNGTAFTPTGSACRAWPPLASETSLPVACVDWCDARAYCRWAGKRLCGRTGGGGQLSSATGAAANDEWYLACSGGGARAFPYGNTYEQKTCNGLDFNGGTLLPVGTLPACTGGYDGLHDMSGNVYEWTDQCDGSSGRADLCHPRGGSYRQPMAPVALRCDALGQVKRGDTYGDVGFRCCSDVR